MTFTGTSANEQDAPIAVVRASVTEPLGSTPKLAVAARRWRSTLVLSDPNTVFPIREITALLRRSCPMWTYKEIAGGGHMAPLTRPDLINPLVRSFLGSHRGDDPAL